MSTVTIRPNQLIADPNGLLFGGAADLADNNDETTASYFASFGQTLSDLKIGFVDPSFGAGAIIDSVKPRIRATTTATANVGIKVAVSGVAEGAYENLSPNASWFTFSGSTRTTKPGGGSWSVADINNLEFWFRYDFVSSGVMQVSELYYDVVYRTPPSVPSGIVQSSSVTVSTPSFQALVTDPDGDTVKARFEIYDNAGSTLIGTFDSAFVSSGSTATGTYSSSLAVGQYKVRAKAIDSGALESAFSSFVDFQINVAINKDLTLLWNVADPTVPVSKDLTLLWDVRQNNIKDLTLLWDVQVTAYKDLTLLWDIKTPWVPVSEDDSIWTEVGEG